MMSLTFGLCTQVSSSGPLGPLVIEKEESLRIILNPQYPSYLDLSSFISI